MNTEVYKERETRKAHNQNWMLAYLELIVEIRFENSSKPARLIIKLNELNKAKPFQSLASTISPNAFSIGSSTTFIGSNLNN